MTDCDSPPESDRRWSLRGLSESLGGDDTLAAEVAALFLAECPALLDAVHDAFDRADLAAASRAAHSLKGAISSLSTGPAYTAAAAVESAAHAADDAATRRSLDQLDHALAALMAGISDASRPYSD